ncbi:uncharacterized protein V6R79_021409 [Siganus canaliculatus]
MGIDRSYAGNQTNRLSREELSNVYREYLLAAVSPYRHYFTVRLSELQAQPSAAGRRYRRHLAFDSRTETPLYRDKVSLPS